MNDILARLITAGTPADLVAEVAMELARARAAVEALDGRKARDRSRQAAKRQRDAGADASREVTGDNVMSRDSRDVTDSPLSPAPLLSPQTPQITPHPHTPGNKPRARKGDFPKPDWADEQLWADFLTNRKTKRLSNTATAHRMFLADIDRFSDEEWPPGRLLEFAVARGWGAIFDPRNRDVSHVTARQNRNPAEPTDALVRTVARRQAERAAGRLHDDEQRAGGWA